MSQSYISCLIQSFSNQFQIIWTPVQGSNPVGEVARSPVFILDKLKDVSLFSLPYLGHQVEFYL